MSKKDSKGGEPVSEIAPQAFSGSIPAGEAIGKLLLREKGIDIPLPENVTEIIIGRSDPVIDIYPDIDLSTYDAERNGVSRRHARIMVDQSNIFIEDLNSTNFTFLNRLRLQPGQRYPLHNGDEIRLGLFVMDYLSNSPH